MQSRGRASNMAGNEGKKPGKSGAARPPVIDVQARKVKGDKPRADSPAAKSAGKKQADAGKAGKAADAKDSRKADKPASTTTAQEAKARTGQPKAEKSSSAKSAAKSAKPDAASGKKPEKPEKKRRKGGAGWKLLLGLLLLGGAAGGGAWVYQQYGPQKTIMSLQQRLAALERKTQAAAPADAIKALEEKLAQVRQEQQKLSASVHELQKGSGGDLPLKVKALEEKLGQLEKLAPALRENVERTAALEKTLAGLQQQMTTVKQGLEELAAGKPATNGEATAGAAESGGSTGEATAGAGVAASGAALVALKLSVQELQQKLAALNERMAALRQAADPARLQALEGRMGKQEQALIRAQEELRGLAQKAQVAAERAAEQARAAQQAIADLRAHPPTPKFTPPPASVAYAALREKAKAGEPFKAELDKLAALLPGAPGLDALTPLAAQGVPATAALRKQLAALAHAYAGKQAQAQKPAGNDPLAMLKQRLSSVVKVRRAGEVDWAGKLKAALARLDAGGLPAAVAELAPLAGDKMPRDVAQWLASARARLRADKALDALADAVLQHAGKAAEQ